jgi:ParB/RepB/Spo0J family partition protein
VDIGIINRNEIDFGARRREDYGNLEQLAASIREKGLIQPIAIWQRPTPLKEGELPYLLLAGGRRFQATAINQMTELPCRIFNDPDLDDLLYREIELIENLERKDLSWSEEVKMKKELNDLMTAKYGRVIDKGNANKEAEDGWTHKKTADILGSSRPSVSQDIRLAEMMKVIPQLADAPTKSDANKLLKKLQNMAVNNELLAQIDRKQASGGMDALKSQLISNYILRDCMEGIRELPDKSCDIVEIDPPYAIDLNNVKKGMENFSAQYDECDYNEIDPQIYIPFINNLLKEVYRVMSEHSWLIFWYAREPWQEVIFRMIADNGFNVKRIGGLWAKPNGQTRCPERYLANAKEDFYYASKGTPQISRPGRSNVFTYNTVPPTKKIHPTERPVELIQDILSTFGWPGARLMIPFLGSGNTLLAGANLKMSAFGYDLSKPYKDGYTIRVSEGTPGMYASLPSSQALTFGPV